MLWTHDCLDSMAREPVYRGYHHQTTLSAVSANSENDVPPISHDEVVDGQGIAAARGARDAGSRTALAVEELDEVDWATPAPWTQDHDAAGLACIDANDASGERLLLPAPGRGRLGGGVRRQRHRLAARGSPAGLPEAGVQRLVPLGAWSTESSRTPAARLPGAVPATLAGWTSLT